MTSTTQDLATNLERPAVHLHLGGEKRASGSAGTHDHIDPSTGQVDRTIPLAGAAEVDEAVQIAHSAFSQWRTTAPAERRRLLHVLADLIEQNNEEFIRRGTFDNGCTPATVAGLIEKSVEWTRYYAGWADKISSEVTSTFGNGGEFSYTIDQPYGVIGVIITWNGPLISLAMKIPAALAAGNTIVVKPSELTPFTGELFAELVAAAGIPPGVVNILPGDADAGAALVAHPLVKKITFTGGPDTARRILHSCADEMKPVVLELGGKSANIIFDDADLDAACTQGTMMSIAALSGQGCALPTRMLVQDTIYDEVIARVTALAGYIKVGHPLDPTTVSGPVVNQAALDRILGMIDRAKNSGARLITGGSRIGGELAGGYYIEPTIFADVDPASELAQTEVFGPVLAITKFSTEEEAIDIANSTRYGLSGYIQTKDLRRAHRVAEKLETGEVLINGAVNLGVTRPFGGIGISGTGKEGGRLGLQEFLQTKSIGIA
ncbi:aldehyde dehydrogenase (plasmid) [Rhodococcus sp. BH4]|uniref:aldehyde dehydrogenase family protein n=1 Tax=Rhodococcus sp. BH4 TaxID=1807790 RepID=UPI0009C2E822|nr:aldehyde dehydrogenase family protein [Rhodococcus sp. BH4]ARE38202.1 aldehyde dehydrogenase [Rhodococcus sp. BH4]